jgi:hypothetical protein
MESGTESELMFFLAEVFLLECKYVNVFIQMEASIAYYYSKIQGRIHSSQVSKKAYLCLDSSCVCFTLLIVIHGY